MPRTACAAVAVAWACSSSPPGHVDARIPPDVRPHPDADTTACEQASTRPPGATGVVTSGVYVITWTPIAGEVGSVNPLIDTTRLTIDTAAGTARYDSPSCADCVGMHSGVIVDGCLVVARGADGITSRREYQLCATATGVIADLVWCGFPGSPDPRTWRVIGMP